MKSQVQLVLATVGLTALIWVYADQQGYKTVKFPVAVTISTSPGIVAHVDGAGADARQTLLVMVIARGPNAAMRELPLARPPAMEVTVPIAENPAPDEHRVVDIHDPVAVALRERGLQLLNVNPANMGVRFDRLVKLDVQVQADAGALRPSLAGSVQIDPPVVTATVLASQLAGMPTSNEPQRLVISIEEDLRSQPGETDFRFTVSLKNRPWHGLEVKWEPDALVMSGKLQQLFSDLELRLIPLRVLLPWDWPSDKYEIVWVDERDRLQKLQLKVPVGKILTHNDVTAFISIDGSLIPPAVPADLTTQPASEPSPFTHTVRFVFPPGFEDVRIVSPPSMVKFRIMPRAQAEATKSAG